MELIQDKNSRSGVIGTILVHLLLLLLFVSFGMPYQDPPPVNEGAMLINFGNSGGGSSSKEEPSEENESSSSSASSENNTENNSSQENIQTTDNETVDLNASQNNATTTEPKVSESLNNVKNALSNANNSSSNNNSNNNSNSNSNNNSSSNSNGSNTGPSNGIGFDLGGRGKVSFKKPDNPTQEDGKVVVAIVVDRDGKVIKAKAGARGSTTTNPVLQKKAEEAAYKAKFKKDATAPFEQKGTMTFVFILN